MKLKTVTVGDKTYAEVVDGKPVYVYDDNKEVPFDAPANVAKISALNAEAKGHREAKEAAEEVAKKYEGIEDPEAARTALETVANLKSGDLTTAAKVEEIKREAKKAADEQVAEVKRGLEAQLLTFKNENVSLRTGWDSERIGTAFANSKLVADKLAVPGAVAQKIFGENFKIEEGKMVAYKDGQKVYSRENPGDAASFDEALGTLVDTYAFRDSIVRGSGGGSGGGNRGGGSGGGGAKELTRAEFDALAPLDRGAKIKDGYTVVDTNQ